MEQPLDSAGVCHVSRGTCRDQHCCSGDTGNGRVGGRGGGWGGTMNRCYDCHSENCHLSPRQPRSLGPAAAASISWRLGTAGRAREHSPPVIFTYFIAPLLTPRLNTQRQLNTIFGDKSIFEKLFIHAFYFVVRRLLIREALKVPLDWSHGYKISIV